MDDDLEMFAETAPAPEPQVTATSADAQISAALEAFAQDGRVVTALFTADLRQYLGRDLVLDLKGGVLVVGLLRSDLADEDAAYRRWLKNLRAAHGCNRSTVRVDWTGGPDPARGIRRAT